MQTLGVKKEMAKTSGSDRFRDILCAHIREKRLQTDQTYEQINKELGLGGKNYVFRASTGDHEGNYSLGVPSNLHKILNWLDLTPHDFVGEAGTTRWGDVADVILRMEAVSLHDRRQLVDVVEGFLKSAPRVQ